VGSIGGRSDVNKSKTLSKKSKSKEGWRYGSGGRAPSLQGPEYTERKKKEREKASFKSTPPEFTRTQRGGTAHHLAGVTRTRLEISFLVLSQCPLTSPRNEQREMRAEHGCSGGSSSVHLLEVQCVV
jgi:hypothetical protein